MLARRTWSFSDGVSCSAPATAVAILARMPTALPFPSGWTALVSIAAYPCVAAGTAGAFLAALPDGTDEQSPRDDPGRLDLPAAMPRGIKMCALAYLYSGIPLTRLTRSPAVSKLMSL